MYKIKILSVSEHKNKTMDAAACKKLFDLCSQSLNNTEVSEFMI